MVLEKNKNEFVKIITSTSAVSSTVGIVDTQLLKAASYIGRACPIVHSTSNRVPGMHEFDLFDTW